MKFKLEYIMEVEDSELLDIINERDGSTYSSIDEIPEEKIIDTIYEYDYIGYEIDYKMLIDNIKVTKINNHESLSNTRFY